MSETAIFLACYAPLFFVSYYLLFLVGIIPSIFNNAWYYVSICAVSLFVSFSFWLRFEYGLSDTAYLWSVLTGALGIANLLVAMYLFGKRA
jgi:hypothetical protein